MTEQTEIDDAHKFDLDVNVELCVPVTLHETPLTSTSASASALASACQQLTPISTETSIILNVPSSLPSSTALTDFRPKSTANTRILLPTFKCRSLSRIRSKSKSGLRSRSILRSNLTLRSISASKYKYKSKQYGERLCGGQDKGSTLSLTDRDDLSESGRGNKLLNSILRYSRIFILFVCWILITVFSLMFDERTQVAYLVTLMSRNVSTYDISYMQMRPTVIIQLEGALALTSFQDKTAITEEIVKDHLSYVSVWIKELDKKTKQWINVTKEWRIRVQDTTELKYAPLIRVETVLDQVLSDHVAIERSLLFYTNVNQTLPLNVILDSTTMTHELGVIFSTVLLLIIYIHIVFELVNLTLAGVVCSTLGIAVLGVVQLKPAFTTIIQWIHFDTILFYFGFSIIMGMLTETHLTEYMAALAYELSNGHIWPLLNVVILFSFIMGALYNNLSVILFATPICLRICEVMGLRPSPMLCCLIISSNVGASLTPFGSANSLIRYHPSLGEQKIHIITYVIHMLPATILAAAQSYLHLRLQFINSDKMRYTQSVEERRLKHLIKVWRKAANTVGETSLDERTYQDTVNTRVNSLRKRLKRLGKMPKPPANYDEKVQLLRENNRIQNGLYLGYCAMALLFSILVPLLNAFNLGNLSAGWVVILAALLTLSLACANGDLDKIMSRIDWSTMLFIVSLFILMEVLKRLGLLQWVGSILENSLSKVDQKYILLCAILSILWLSALLSAFMDNVPIADMMMHIIVRLTQNIAYDLPSEPLIWALALGCTLGCNGTLMGGLPNIACAGLANAHGYSFKFVEYFKVGFLIMIGSITLASIYLIIAHVAIQWH